MARVTEQVEILLMTIESPDITGGPLRLTQNNIPVTSRGEVFTPAAFNFGAPSPDDPASSARILVDNVDLSVTKAVEGLTEAAAVKVEIVLSGEPDIVDFSYLDFDLSVIGWDLWEVEGTLTVPDDSLEPFCSFNYDPSFAPALHV